MGSKAVQSVILGDVRPTSYDARWAGVVFTGAIDEACAQARAQAATEPKSRYNRARAVRKDRLALLQFLGVAS